MSKQKRSSMFKTEQLAESYYEAYRQTLSLWNIDYESLYIPTSYGDTHVLVCGPADGEPVVLLHGFGFSATMWYPNVETLARTHRVYAIDVIGEFNRSEIKKDMKMRRDYADWLLQVLDGFDIEKAAFIGHSNGGWHALNFAMHEPDRVSRILLLAPAASFASFSIQFPIRVIAINLIRTRSFIIGFFGKWFVAKNNTISEHLLEQFYQGIKGFGWKHKIIIPSVFTDEELMKVQVPCTLLIGDREVIYNVNKVMTRAKKVMPRIRTAVIPGAGHALSIERASDINAHMAEFLTSAAE